MSKKYILIVILAVVVGLIAVKAFYKNAETSKLSVIESSEVGGDFRSIIEKYKVSGKPSIIVFSYDADCCESTKNFFNDYNTSIRNIMNENKDRFNTLFINTGGIPSEQQNDVKSLAKEHDVSHLPSVLIIDKQGKDYKVVLGKFKDEDVKKLLDGLK